MESTLLLWVAGIIVLLLIIFYVLLNWRSNLIAIINEYSDCQEVSDCFMGYIVTNMHVQNAKKNKLRWIIFGPKYLDLINYQSERLLHSFERLRNFESCNENSPLLKSMSLCDQWEGIQNTVFERKGMEGAPYYEVKNEYGFDPFGYMGIAFSNKMYELYKKYLLHTLRTRDYYAFDAIIKDYYEISEMHPSTSPFYRINKDITPKIITDAAHEISEKIWIEFNSITNAFGISKEAEIEKVSKLKATDAYRIIFNNIVLQNDKKIKSYKESIENYPKKVVIKRKVS